MNNIINICKAIIILIKIVCLVPFMVLVKFTDIIKPKLTLTLLLLQNEAETLFVNAKRKDNDN